MDEFKQFGNGLFAYSSDGKSLKVRKRTGVYTITVGETYGQLDGKAATAAGEEAAVVAIIPPVEGVDPRVSIKTTKRRTACLAYEFVSRYDVPFVPTPRAPKKEKKSEDDVEADEMAQVLARIEAKLDFIMKTLGVSLEDPVIKAAVDAAARTAKTLPPTLGG